MQPNKFVYTDRVAEEAATAYGLGSITFKRFKTSYRDNFKNTGAPRGTSNTIRIPILAEYLVQKSLAFQPQPSLQRTIPLTIDKAYVIDTVMNLPETTFLVNSESYSQSGELGMRMGKSMTASMDADLIDYIVGNTNGAINTEDLDSNYQNLESLNAALEQLQENAISTEGLDVMTAIISPKLGRFLRTESRPLYNPANDVSAMFGGQIPKDVYGFHTLVSNRLGTHTTKTAIKGTSVAATFIDGSDVITCANANTFAVGDPVYLRKGSNPVQIVEPYSKVSTNGMAIRKIKSINGNQIILSEPVYFTTGFKNVSDLPTHIAAVLSPGTTYSRAIAAHADAVEYAFIDIDVPSPTSGVTVSTFGGEEEKLKITAMYGWIFEKRVNAMSLLAFGGFASPRPDWATTIYLPLASGNNE
jgi:hypothetical protein